VSTAWGNAKRRRVSGVLNSGARGLTLQNESGDFWVLETADIDPELIGKPVTVQGTLIGLDRLQLDWIGATEPGC